MFHAERNQVQVVVIVRDAHGRPVANLKQSAFKILDEGKPQAIRSFSLQQRSSGPELQGRAEKAQVLAAESKCLGCLGDVQLPKRKADYFSRH